MFRYATAVGGAVPSTDDTTRDTSRVTSTRTPQADDGADETDEESVTGVASGDDRRQRADERRTEPNEEGNVITDRLLPLMAAVTVLFEFDALGRLSGLFGGMGRTVGMSLGGGVRPPGFDPDAVVTVGAGLSVGAVLVFALVVGLALLSYRRLPEP